MKMLGLNRAIISVIKGWQSEPAWICVEDRGWSCFAFSGV